MNGSLGGLLSIIFAVMGLEITFVNILSDIVAWNVDSRGIYIDIDSQGRQNT